MDHSPAAASDAELVRAIQQDRSDSAFSILYDRHTARAFQTAWRILGGNMHQAEDAMQDAWVRAVSTLDTWRNDVAFGGWLRSITAHVAIDMMRRERRISFETDVEIEAPRGPGEQIDLEVAIAALAPGYRAVLVLHDVEGFTHDEIAAQLGIAAGTSKGQLFKARRAVRARLTPDTAEKT